MPHISIDVLNIFGELESAEDEFLSEASYVFTIFSRFWRAYHDMAIRVDALFVQVKECSFVRDIPGP
jgi:hypothetical protein